MPIDGFITPDWPAAANVRARVTTRTLPGASISPFDTFNLGAHCGDALDAVQENRRRLMQLANLPTPPHWLKQVHGINVLRFDAPSESDGSVSSARPGNPESQGPSPEANQADASTTSRPGVVLAVLTADCLPVLFASTQGDEIAAAHAGWRGLADGVLEATVAAMRTDPANLMAWLGPAAGPQVYEIGEEVRAAFLTHDPGTASCFATTRPNHYLINLYALARRRLAAVGVTAIFGGGLCTISNAARFYSYRRDGRSGRMASLVWLAPTS